MRLVKEVDFPKWRPPKLKEGKCYRFTPLTQNGAVRKTKSHPKNGGDGDLSFVATVEKEYKRWYLLATPAGYYTTMARGAVGIDWEAKRV